MKPIVVIGGVAAGMSAASQIKRQKTDQEVIVFEKGPYISYGACGMPFYVSGEIKDYNRLIVLKPEKAIQERKIDVRIKHEVLEIDRKNKRVLVKNLENQNTFYQDYEKLVIASGSQAFIPPLENKDLKNIFVLKTLEDGIRLNQFLETEKPQKGVIIGGGFIGVELAESFRKRGITTILVEAAPRVLGVLDASMSQLVLEELQKNKVEVFCSEKLIGFEGKDKVTAVVTENRKIETDFVLLSIGVIPQSDLAKNAGLMLGDRNAILVNRFLQTSDPDIFAGGDCATVYHSLLEKDLYIPLALGANRQGRMCGENIGAALKNEPMQPFPGILGSAMTKVFDLEVGKTGIGEGEISRYGIKNIEVSEIQYFAKAGYYPERSKIWVKLFYDKETKIIKGGQIVGQSGSVLRLDVISVAIAQKMTLSQLYEIDMGYCPPFSPVWDPLLVAARNAMD